MDIDAFDAISRRLRQTTDDLMKTMTHQVGHASSLVHQGSSLIDEWRSLIKEVTPPIGLGSVDIISTPYLADTVLRQVRFPRSKRKRIRRKWAKDMRNWREVPNRNRGPYLAASDTHRPTLFCSPKDYQRIIDAVRKEQEKYPSKTLIGDTAKLLERPVATYKVDLSVFEQRTPHLPIWPPEVK